MNPFPKSNPKYKGKPIRQLFSLAKALNVSLDHLIYVSELANAQYRIAMQVPKSDGSIRVTYDAKPLLKSIHQRIKSKILDRVIFPSFLTGSIKGCDYKTNAELHKGAAIVISEDIGSFFPSTTSERVFDVWKNFFGFSHEVALCLTTLTTKDGELPQGAITSAHIANLVFWRDEPSLWNKLAAQGITYSRFVDDIAVSSSSVLAEEKKTEIVSAIYSLMHRNGFKPKRSKHEISTAKQRMIVTKLTVNQKPGLSKEERSKIRANVHSFEKLVLDASQPLYQLKHQYSKVMGKINHLARFHPGEAKKLKMRMTKLKPCLDF